MKFEIKHKLSGAVLFSCEAESLKDCVEAAIKAHADLSYADLSYANLSRADLSYADLSRADLSYADLFYVNLSHADLSYADLSHANLFHAKLSHAELFYADLSRAKLSYADLSHASLSYANLSNANGVSKNRITALTMLLEQPGKIRAYKLVAPDGLAPFNGNITYKVGRIYKEPQANTNDKEPCAKGINLATLDWCLANYQKGYRVLIAEFTAKDIACVPIATDGKFRVFKCKIVGEKDILGDL
ncbi:MAG: pentapeptide repeat-containing protein [Gammaproteobacteria bacterium]